MARGVKGSHVESHIFSIHSMRVRIERAKEVLNKDLDYSFWYKFLIERFGSGEYYRYTREERDKMFLPQVAAEVAIILDGACRGLGEKKEEKVSGA